MVMLYIFVNLGLFGVFLYVLDVCGNIRDVDFCIVFSFFLVEWSYFFVKIKE